MQSATSALLPYDVALSRAHFALVARSYRDARNLFAYCHRWHPTNRNRAYLELANGFVRTEEGRRDDAVEHFRAALQLDGEAAVIARRELRHTMPPPPPGSRKRMR
jgi:tetratricopeptide (TPR) repeat protein